VTRVSAAPPSPLSLAVLGCGYAAELHAAPLRAQGVACSYASRDGERARAFNRRLRGQGAFASYAAALASRSIDAVLVATPPASHLELTLGALRAGKHVIVEKPPFLRAADFAPVREAARAAGRRVFVAENYHYKPLARVLRRLLAEGAIGDVRFVHLNALKAQPAAGWRADDALAGGGALYEGGIHWVSFAANLGLRVRAARGFGARDPRHERGLTAVFDYEGGAVGTLSYSWEIPSPLGGLRVSRLYGRAGSIAFESNGLWAAVWGRRKRIYFPDPFDLVGRRAMWRDFAQALRAGTEPEMSFERAQRDLELVEEIYASLGRGA
jgi:predicted dehydrogenase